MSESHHDETFESADAGASLTYPQQAGTIRKNGFMVAKGRPCKVRRRAAERVGAPGVRRQRARDGAAMVGGLAFKATAPSGAHRSCFKAPPGAPAICLWRLSRLGRRLGRQRRGAAFHLPLLAGARALWLQLSAHAQQLQGAVQLALPVRRWISRLACAGARTCPVSLTPSNRIARAHHPRNTGRRRLDLEDGQARPRQV